MGQITKDLSWARYLELLLCCSCTLGAIFLPTPASAGLLSPASPGPRFLSYLSYEASTQLLPQTNLFLLGGCWADDVINSLTMLLSEQEQVS